jgi:hypothetical protein
MCGREDDTRDESKAAAAAPIDLFRDCVRARPSLQQTLLQPDDEAEFIARALEAARDCGFALDAGDIKAAMRGRLSGMPAIVDMGDRETGLPPEGWFPSGAFWRGGRLYVQWAHFGSRRLTQPLYETDIQLRLRKPFNRLIRYATPIDRLAEWLTLRPPLRPDGFIFHVSRCGSTLVSQMLAALPQHLVISEAGALDAVVRAPQLHPGMSEQLHLQWLRWMIGALGQPRAGSESAYFIKFDALHTMALPLLVRAFPDVPRLFLYRDPVEVLASHLREPGFHVLAGADPYLSGIDYSDVMEHPENFGARVLARLCGAALQQAADSRMLLLNYRQLPQAVWSKVAPHFGVACSADGREAMAEAARFDAKVQGVEFVADAEAKQRTASASLRAEADKQVGELYRRLEALRAGGDR